MEVVGLDIGNDTAGKVYASRFRVHVVGYMEAAVNGNTFMMDQFQKRFISEADELQELLVLQPAERLKQTTSYNEEIREQIMNAIDDIINRVFDFDSVKEYVVIGHGGKTELRRCFKDAVNDVLGDPV